MQKFGRQRDTIRGPLDKKIRRLTDCAMAAWLQQFDNKISIQQSSL
jgi:hypothetical protein